MTHSLAAFGIEDFHVYDVNFYDPFEYPQENVLQMLANSLRSYTKKFAYPDYTSMREIEERTSVPQRLQATEELVRNYTGEDYSVDRHIANSVRVGGTYYCQIPIFSDYQIVANHNVFPDRVNLSTDGNHYGVVISPQPDRHCLISAPTFEIADLVFKGSQLDEEFYKDVFSGYSFIDFVKEPPTQKTGRANIERWKFPTLMQSPGMLMFLQDLQLLDKYKHIIGETIELTGHDFLHTFTNQSFDTENPQANPFSELMSHLYFGQLNRPQTLDVEHLALILNQEVFRHGLENPERFTFPQQLFGNLRLLNSHIDEICKAAPANKAETVEMIFRAQALFFASNYAPRKLLLENSPEKWEEIIRDVEPKYSPIMKVADGKNDNTEMHVLEVVAEIGNALDETYKPKDRISQLGQSKSSEGLFLP